LSCRLLRRVRRSDHRADGAIALAAANVPRATASPEDARAAPRPSTPSGSTLSAGGGADGNVVVFRRASPWRSRWPAPVRGATADEMDAVLRDVATDANAAWLNAVDQALAARSGTFKDTTGQQLDVTLRIANAPFAQRDMTLQPAYLEALATRFGTGLRLVDYIHETEAARRLINGWVDQQTEQRIPELLVPGVLTPDTRMALANAIYLKAPWLTPFSADATKPGPFTRADGSTIEVPMMSLGAAPLRRGRRLARRRAALTSVGRWRDRARPRRPRAVRRPRSTRRGFAAIVGAFAERQVSLVLPEVRDRDEGSARGRP
jgi:serpin B